MALDMYRTDRIEVDYTLDVRDKDKQPVSVSSVQVALLPFRSSPTADTVWATKSVTDDVLTVVYAAPDATDEAGDLLPPLGGSDLFMNDVSGDFRKATRIERINVV